MRKPRKRHATALLKEQAMAAKYGNMLRDVPAETWPARMPAYCYTGLCPVPGLRGHPPGEGREAIGQGDIGAVHRCL